jgi:hypothetical protein
MAGFFANPALNGTLSFGLMPHAEADYRKYPAEHSRSAGRAGFFKIDCLPNDPSRLAKQASGESGYESKLCSLA